MLRASLTSLSAALPGSPGSPKHRSPKSREGSAFKSAPSQSVINLAGVLLQASADNATLLVELGFVAPIVEMLRSGMGDAIRLVAARTLANMCSHRDHQAVVVDAGALPILLTLLTEARRYPPLAVAALHVLRPLARDANIKVMFREEGGFPALVDLMTMEGDDINAESDCDAIAEATVGVVRNLATLPVNQEALRAAGATKALVSLLDAKVPSSRTSIASATAISNLVVGNQANKNAIRTAGGVEKLVGMLCAGPASAIAATEALGNLAVKNATNKDAIRQCGGVAALAEQMRAAKQSLKATHDGKKRALNGTVSPQRSEARVPGWRT